MIYCYRCELCGLDHQTQAPIGKAPITVACSCGGAATRCYAAENKVVNGNPFMDKYPYVSNRLPKNLEGCRTDAKGKPVIESRQHERNIMAKHGYRRD